MLTPLIRSFRARAEALIGNTDGNVAIIFALSLVPMVGLMGLAIDYSRASSARTAMQAALDSTTLMLSKEAGGLTSAALTTKANTYFLALLNYKDIQISSTSPITAATYTTTKGSQLTLSASGSVKTDFLSVFKALGCSTCNQIPFNSTSSVKWGQSRLRVALVLDNTGSMSQHGKIGALKTATTNLLSQLQNAATTAADVYVSIIPFSDDVNIGNVNGANASATWLEWTGWNALNGSCSRGWYQDQSDCAAGGFTWTAASHQTWNGCVTDRGTPGVPNGSPGTVSTPAPSGAAAGQQYDQLSVAPDTTKSATLFPADQSAYCPLQLMGLSNSWSTMNTLVSNMTPNGSTNQPIGLVWGWMSLVGTAPLSAPAMDPNYQYQQVIILLSDGLNTQDRWNGDGSSTSTQVDSRMLDSATPANGTCTNIKKAGITIYTVQVNTDGDPVSTLLQNCATDASHFFELTSSDQIVTTFNQIGTNLSRLRLAQ